MKNRYITVDFDNKSISNMLENIIVCQNKKEIIKLISPLILDNDTAAKWFVKLMNGSKLPDIIENGTICTVNIKDLGWLDNSDKELLLQNGEEIICKIVEFNGYHTYYQYDISFNIEKDGKSIEKQISVKSDTLVPIEEF